MIASQMALNTEPLAARLGGKGKELNLEKTTSSGRPKRQKTTHAPATPGTQPSTVNGESTSIGDQAGAPCTGVSFDVPDIWALIFEDPRIQNDGNTLATFARVNRAIGTFAVRLLYRDLTVKTTWTTSCRAKRALAIIRSVSGTAMYPYCQFAWYISVQDMAYAFALELADSDEFIRTILQVNEPHKFQDLPLDLNYARDRVSVAISRFIQQNVDQFPRIHHLSTQGPHLVIPLPLVFTGIEELTLDGWDTSDYLGRLVRDGCPQLRALCITLPSSDFHDFYSNPDTDVHCGITVAGFLDELYPNSLKRFGISFVDVINDDPDCRACGLPAGDAEKIIRSLRRQKLESLRLVRMHGAAYRYLGEYREALGSLQELDIAFPDHYWGNREDSLIPQTITQSITDWLKRCRNLRRLKWESQEGRKSRRGMHSEPADGRTTWTCVLAQVFRHSPAMKLQLRELHLNLRRGKSRVYHFLSFLENLELLHITVDPSLVPPLGFPNSVKELRTEATKYLTRSLNRMRKLRRVHIEDSNFLIYDRVFPWCKADAFGTGSPESVRDIPALKTLTITCASCPLNVVFWKWVSHFPLLEELRIDGPTEIAAQGIDQFIKRTQRSFAVDKKLLIVGSGRTLFEGRVGPRSGEES